MPISVTAKETFRVGSTFVIEGPSDGAPYLCVFEDDGDTGYLYAVDVSGEELQILDAVHIYNCLLYTSPSPRDISGSRMPSSA